MISCSNNDSLNDDFSLKLKLKPCLRSNLYCMLLLNDTTSDAKSYVPSLAMILYFLILDYIVSL